MPAGCARRGWGRARARSPRNCVARLRSCCRDEADGGQHLCGVPHRAFDLLIAGRLTRRGRRHLNSEALYRAGRNSRRRRSAPGSGSGQHGGAKMGDGARQRSSLVGAPPGSRRPGRWSARRVRQGRPAAGAGRGAARRASSRVEVVPTRARRAPGPRSEPTRSASERGRAPTANACAVGPNAPAGSTTIKRSSPMLAIARAEAPMFPSSRGLTRMTAGRISGLMPATLSLNRESTGSSSRAGTPSRPRPSAATPRPDTRARNRRLRSWPPSP